MRVAAAIWEVVSTDRTVHAGATASSVSFWGYSHLADVQLYLAIFAAFFGGLSAAAVFVYTCLKIRRLLNNPKAAE